MGFPSAPHEIRKAKGDHKFSRTRVKAPQMEAASLMGEPAASPLLSSPTTPTTTRARKQPRQALSEADIPALPPADASQEEKARIMKDRRRAPGRRSASDFTHLGSAPPVSEPEFVVPSADRATGFA